MAGTCPNKRSPEWKALVNKYGERMAMVLYKKNGEEIPSLEEAQKLFTQVVTSGSEQQFASGSAIDFDGGAIPPSDVDDKVVLNAINDKTNNPYPTVKEALRRQHSQLIRRLSKVRDQQRTATNAEARKKLSLKFAELSERLERIEEDLQSYERAQNLDDLVSILDNMVANAQELMNLPELSTDDIEELDRMLNLLSAVGNFSTQTGESHIIFSEAEMESDALKYGYTDDAGVFHKGFSRYKEVADNLSRQLNKIKEDHILDITRKQIGHPEVTKQEIFEALKDISAARAYTMDGFSVDDPMVQAFYVVMSKMTIAAERETRERLSALDRLLKKTKSYGKFKDVFAQRYSDGTLTGDLVDRFSPEYYDARTIQLNKAYSSGDWQAFEQWQKENEILLDVNLLFNRDGTPKEGPEVDAYKAELTRHLGEKGAKYYLEEQESRIKLWLENFEARRELFSTKNWTEENKAAALKEYELLTSPFLNADRILNNGEKEQSGIRIGAGASYYNMTIPRRFKSDGKQTNYYDSQFEKIENNSDLLELYDYLKDLLRDLKYMIPADKRIDFHSNTLPDIKTSVISSVGNGIGGTTKGLIDALSNMFKERDLAATDYDEYSLRTGEKIRRARLNFQSGRRQEVDDFVRLKEIELGRKATPEELVAWRKQARAKIAAEKTYDPEIMFKVFSAQVIAFKHRSMQEAALNLLYEGIRSRKQLQVNLAGKVITDEDGNPVELPNGLSNLMKMIQYQYGVAMGEARHSVEGKLKNKTYSNQEKQQLAEYEALKEKLQERLEKGEISQEEFEKQTEFLDKKIDSLGSYVTASKIGDAALKYYTFLGMSYNFLAGGINILTGAFENSLRGMDGRLFSNADLWLFYGKVMQCALPNVIMSSEAKKIKAIDKALDITQSAVNELYDLSNTRGLAKLKKIAAIANPMYITERTEFQNQMPLALAYMNNLKVFSSEDENIKTFYDAFDEFGNIKDGVVLMEGKTNEEALIDLKLKINNLIKMAHGNYSNLTPILAKRDIVGRMLFQFRSWIPEAINSRFGPEIHDYVLGITIKGRYRSFSAAFGRTEFAGQTYSAGQNILFTLKQILRKLTFRKTQFDQRMSEVDAANMRANLQELFIVAAITALIIGLKGLVPDDEESNNPYWRFMGIMLINSLTRYQSDILLYLNPAEYEKISKNTVPVLGLVSNFERFFNAAWKYILDAEDDRHWEAFIRRTLSLFPILSQVPRAYNYGSKFFEN